jgi:predicted O-linked N-acetylglucosamine transferase (SPINDLY family)
LQRKRRVNRAYFRRWSIESLAILARCLAQPIHDMTDTPEAAAITDLLGRAIEQHRGFAFDEAERLYREVLAQAPAHADAWHNLGVLYAIGLGRPLDALPHFEAALNADGGRGQFWFSYIDALIRAAQWGMAEQVLAMAGDHGLGRVQAQSLAERLARAQSVARAPAPAAAPLPDQPTPAAPPAPSEPAARAVAASTAPLAQQQALVALFQRQAHAQGEALARELLRSHPDDGFLWKSLGAMLQGQGRQQEALAAKQRAAELAPNDVEVLCNLGRSYFELERRDEAAAALRAALHLQPDHAQAWNNLGLVLNAQGQVAEAGQHFERAIALRPDFAEALNNLSGVHVSLGQVDEAVDVLSRAVAAKPNYRAAFDNLLFALNYHPDASAEEIYAGYAAYDAAFGAPERVHWLAHDNPPAAGRRLRVGYVSPDFRQHACSFFLEPLLAQHDRTVVEVFAYAELKGHGDATTVRLRALVDHWIPTRGMDATALAAKIRADRIDILIDLAGHTKGNRLDVFARKPAPVSLSWMGFGTTTGLQAIDYYLTDAASVPEGSEHLFSERPWRLPDLPFTAYRPGAGMGEPGPLPALARGALRLGTLTRGVRVNHHTLRVWSQILRRLPDAVLVLDSRSFKDPAMAETMAARFAEHGIARERLDIGCHSPPWDLLRAIDIGLDCFPHNSGTTLVEMLYMGVPVVSLAGRPSVGRIGSAILQAVGRAEWIAWTEVEYVDKVVALAQDLPALAATRASLRGQVQASALMDEVGFARGVEQAYRQMFDAWDAAHADRGPRAAAGAVSVDAEITALRAELLYNEGNALHEQGDAAGAEARWLAALALVPTHAETLNNLGLLQQEQSRMREAEASYRAALRARPDSPVALHNLGNVLPHRGEFEEAVECYERALALGLQSQHLFDNFLFILNYHPQRSAEQIYAAYVEYDRRFGRPHRASWKPHANDLRTTRRLKIGYVSPDFREHACGRFLEPLLAGHDKTQVEVWAYAELKREDAATARYRGVVDHWVPTQGLSDEAVAERIRADGIDVLVDVAGHTVGNRLGVFARKPAPVSLSWLGYGYTTGLQAIDYYLTDAASVPVGSEHLFSETPWRLPVGFVFRPSAGMGEPGPLPALRHGHVRLGTLSRSIRLNAPTVRAWAAILHRLPGARLVVDSRNFSEAAACERLRARFAELGIGADRLEIGFHTPPWDLLRSIDIGLDCFPHNSGTTLVEMLYMGIPVVTLAGRASVGRLGSALLHGMGRPEWIAQTEADYIDRVVGLAQDLPALAALRASLRSQLEASPLMDQDGFTRAVEQAYRAMFERFAARVASDPTQQHQTLAELFRARRFAEGEALARSLVERDPRDGFAWKALGVMLQALGQPAASLTAKQQAASLLPDDVEALCNLGHGLQDSDRYAEAERVLLRALARRPDTFEALNNLAITYQKQGRLDEALAHFERALALQPGAKGVYDNYLFTLNYHAQRSAEDIYAAYQEYDRRFGQPLRGGWQPHANPRHGARRLKVGYVSPDFREHACGRFLEPLLAAHDKAQVEVWAYAELTREDAVTARYRGHVDHWVPTRGLSDEALAERIRADGIDVLVDVAGHTAGNRLGVFARKPAPVSLSWLGYGYTTGLQAIDYYLTDAASVPEGSESLFAETPWRLPAGFVYRPSPGMGEPGPLPALRHGHVRLGTLTRAVRINAQTVQVWSQILHRLPNARLVVDSRSFADAAAQQALCARFAEQGIGADRLDIGYHSPPWDVLRSIDIGLDCFPHNSGTTLFESLYLGVPFVTLAGRASVGRLGSSILQALGRPEWIANDAQGYIDRVVALAQDLPALATTRAALRSQLQASALMDERGFAQTVEQAYAAMFAQWCAGDAHPLLALVGRAHDLHERGEAALEQGLADQAESCWRQALRMVPEFAQAHASLGRLLQQQGRLVASEAAYRAALELQADSALTHYNLATCLLLQERPGDAETALLHALEHDAGLAPARALLDRLQHEQGRWLESEERWREALRQQPEDLNAYLRLAQVLRRQHRHAEAQGCLRRAEQLAPQDLSVLRQQAALCKEMGRPEEAERICRRVLEAEPESAQAWNQLAEMLNVMQRLSEAEQGFRRALALDPQLAMAHGNLGIVLQNQGRQQEAEDAMRAGLALRPDDAGAHGNLLFVLNYHPGKSMAQVFEEYRLHDERFYARHRSEWRPHRNRPAAGRPLRIGYVSPDFRNHSCMYFVEPLLAHHDHQAVTVYAYAELQKEDDATARYKNLVDHWIPTRGMGDAALAERIRADGIDILIDLAGHTAGNRLGVFARKPAPVSASWMGYGYSTGLSAIDYFLTDAWHAPAGSEAYFSETPWRLPVGWVYRPPAEKQTGRPGPLPALANGVVTFGTLTRAVRINDDTVRVWSALLQRVPGSRLVVDSRSFRDAQTQTALAERFAAHGIAPERLQIGCSASGWEVLRRIDISLDCFPHNSGTTLFESLHLGVPFVSWADRPGLGCLGSAILHGAGHPEWVARSETEYIDKAIALASDLPRLAQLREQLPQQLRASPVMDEAAFARAAEEAFRQMFARWEQSHAEGGNA